MNRFLKARGRSGMTQEELAEKAGVGVLTIISLERGKRPNVRITTLFKIADALGVDVEYLEQDIPDPEEKPAKLPTANEA